MNQNISTVNDAMQAPPNVQEISPLALTTRHCEKQKT